MKQKISVIFFSLISFVFLFLDLNLFHAIQTMRFDQNLSMAVPQITCKSVMLDHVNSYIMSPLSKGFEDFTHFTTLLPKLTANEVSFMGVVIAVVASRVVQNESLFVRRIAVLVFLFRQFIDDLDGLVARVRMGVDPKKEVSFTGSEGYIVDGICDAIGFTCFLFAIFWFQNKRKNDLKYKLLSEELSCDHSRQLLRNHVLFGLQMLLSCVLWNRYIDSFHRMLETDQSPIKVEIFKSRLQWIIMWAWRVFGNAHQLMNFLLVSVWLSRSKEFVQWIHVYGFVVLIGLSFLTEIHLNDIETYLKHISMNNK